MCVRFTCFSAFQTVLQNGMRRRSCVCSKDRCNGRVHAIPSVLETFAAATTPSPMVSMHNPLWDHEQHLQTSNGFQSIAVPFVVILIGVLLVLLVAIVVTRIYRYRRRVQSYTYAELTADLSVERA